MRLIDRFNERYIYASDFNCQGIPVANLDLETQHDLRFEIARGLENTSELKFFNMRRMGDTFEEIAQLRPNQKDFLNYSINLLHQNGIVHNDIHFKNIMVNVGEDVRLSLPKLIDFGLSKLQENYDPMQWEELKQIDRNQLDEMFAPRPPRAPKRRNREDDEYEGGGGGGRRGREEDDVPRVFRRNIFAMEEL